MFVADVTTRLEDTGEEMCITCFCLSIDAVNYSYDELDDKKCFLARFAKSKKDKIRS
jgi:hypothetical protein